MKVLMVEPEKVAYEAEIDDSLSAMQKAVGGYIEAVYPYSEHVALVCNEEAKLMGLPLNRALRDKDGEIYDIIAGNFFICGLGEENFSSLSAEHMEKFKKQFQYPEIFIRLNGKFVAIKADGKDIKPPKKGKERNTHER